MDSIFTKRFWLATAERAIKTFCGALATTLGTSALNVFDVSLEWEQSLGIAFGATLISILLSVVSAPVGNKGGPSLSNEVAT